MNGYLHSNAVPSACVNYWQIVKECEFHGKNRKMILGVLNILIYFNGGMARPKK